MFDDEDAIEGRNSFKNKAIMAVTAICLGAIAIIAILEYTDPQYKEFGEDNFYTGYMGEEGDPRESWESMNLVSSIGTDSCDTTLRRPGEYKGGDNADMAAVGAHMWLSLNDKPALSEVTSGYEISGEYSDGDLIIAPGTIRFTNSNIAQSGVDGAGTYIEGYLVDTNFLVRWENVDCWWCHINKTSTKHTAIVGKSGEVTIAYEGYVIGQATVDTVVKIYTYDTNGNLTAASWHDYYSNYGLWSD